MLNMGSRDSLCSSCPKGGYCDNEKHTTPITDCQEYETLIYQNHVQEEEYNGIYEPTYNPEDGSM